MGDARLGGAGLVEYRLLDEDAPAVARLDTAARGELRQRAFSPASRALDGYGGEAAAVAVASTFGGGVGGLFVGGTAAVASNSAVIGAVGVAAPMLVAVGMGARSFVDSLRMRRRQRSVVGCYTSVLLPMNIYNGRWIDADYAAERAEDAAAVRMLRDSRGFTNMWSGAWTEEQREAHDRDIFTALAALGRIQRLRAIVERHEADGASPHPAATAQQRAELDAATADFITRVGLIIDRAQLPEESAELEPVARRALMERELDDADQLVLALAVGSARERLLAARAIER